MSPGTLAAVDVYVWLTYFQFSSVQAMADLEALLRSAQAALTRASETVPSAEERRAEAAAAEALAASGAGDVAKTAVGVAQGGSGGSGCAG